MEGWRCSEGILFSPYNPTLTDHNTKSTRFFIRAVNNYEEGLGKFPSSFDLAYNKYVTCKLSVGMLTLVKGESAI